MTLITVQELRKTYQTKTGPVCALDGFNLSVEQGTVRGLLGSNGAGKTIFMKVLATLLRPEFGRASVAGIDVLADPAKVRPLIGTSGQYAAVDEVLTIREDLVPASRLHRVGTRQAKRRAEELLEASDPTEAVDWPLRGFSGGMRRRVDPVGALVINPPVLFSDESTIGLNLQARMGLWEVIQERVGEGTTVLLTTQHLEEADQPTDSIPVIDCGHVIAEGIADGLKAPASDKRIELTLVNEAGTDRTRRIAASSTGVGVAVMGWVFTTQVGDPAAALIAVPKVLGEEDVELHDAGTHRPILDNVFLTPMGYAAEEQEVAV